MKQEILQWNCGVKQCVLCGCVLCVTNSGTHKGLRDAKKWITNVVRCSFFFLYIFIYLFVSLRVMWVINFYADEV